MDSPGYTTNGLRYDFTGTSYRAKREETSIFSIDSMKSVPDYNSFVDSLSVRDTAASIVRGILEETHHQPTMQQMAKRIAAIHYYVRNNIRYLPDPVGFEYVQSPMKTIETGVGDCGSHAILLASLLNSVGIKTELAYVINRQNLAHLFCMARVEIDRSLGSDYLEEFVDGVAEYHSSMGNFGTFGGVGYWKWREYEFTMGNGGGTLDFIGPGYIVVDSIFSDYPGDMKKFIENEYASRELVIPQPGPNNVWNFHNLWFCGREKISSCGQ